jgi:choline monooxygenase
MQNGSVLPASWYVDPRILEIERCTVFAAGPDYVGCLPRVASRGAFCTVAQHGHGEVLVRDGDEVVLLDNVCLHRGHEILHGHGVAHTLVCPMHRWTYSLRGELLLAPYCDDKPDLCLSRRPLRSWNGILFAGGRDVAHDLASLNGRPELDISAYVYVDGQEEEQPVNWKIPVEVLLENYHVPIIHPGFTRLVEPKALSRAEGSFDSPHFMWQEMKPHPDFARNPASRAFEQWQQAILTASRGELPEFAALISCYPPNIFLEWYPYMFVVTTYTPRAPERTLMTREFFYDPHALAAVPDLAALARAAWDENQGQDDVAHESLQRGRAMLARRDGAAPIGQAAYHPVMEDSVRIFHDVLKDAVGLRLERDRAAPATGRERAWPG